MCRWFAYISPSEPCLLSDVLITPPHAISKQVSTHYLPYLIPHQLVPIDLVSFTESHPSTSLAPPTTSHLPEQSDHHDLAQRNLMLNADGSGIALYTSTASTFANPIDEPKTLEPLVYKSTLQLTSDANFLSLARNASTTCLLAHVRASSSAPVSTLNCHPFVFGRWSIMHNGSVGGFGRIRRQLVDGLGDDVHALIHGGTDSEVLAALIAETIWKRDDVTVRQVVTAIEGTIAKVRSVQKEVLGRDEPSSLNLCVTDGQVLVATRYRNAEQEEPPSLYWSTRAGVTLNSKFPGHPDRATHESRRIESGHVGLRASGEHGMHVIVASEPSTFIEEDWALMPKNAALLFDSESGVTVQELAA